MRIAFPLAVLLATAGPAMASPATAQSGEPLQISRIVTQQEQIRSDATARQGPFKDMPATQRDELLRRQAELLRMLSGKRTADELTQDQRMAAFNTLEWIEAAINDSDDDRLVCRRERRIGSNRMTRVCKTVAQIEFERERARSQLLDRGACVDLGGAGCRGD